MFLTWLKLTERDIKGWRSCDLIILLTESIELWVLENLRTVALKCHNPPRLCTCFHGDTSLTCRFTSHVWLTCWAFLPVMANTVAVVGCRCACGWPWPVSQTAQLSLCVGYTDICCSQIRPSRFYSAQQWVWSYTVWIEIKDKSSSWINRIHLTK